MGKFVIRRTATGYQFHLKAANGETVAVSEVYASQAACKKGAESVAKCADRAKIADLTGDREPVNNPRFELYQDRSGAYRFRLRARNGQIIAVSEGYTTRSACADGIESVRKNAPAAPMELTPSGEAGTGPSRAGGGCTAGSE